MSEIDPPPPNYDGHVDSEKFWEAVTVEMISRGFYTSRLCLASLFRYTDFYLFLYCSLASFPFIIRWDKEPLHCAPKLQLLGSMDWHSY